MILDRFGFITWTEKLHGDRNVAVYGCMHVKHGIRIAKRNAGIFTNSMPGFSGLLFKHLSVLIHFFADKIAIRFR